MWNLVIDTYVLPCSDTCFFFAVVAAFEAGGTLEQVLQRLTALPEAGGTSENIQPQVNSTVAPNGSASSSAPLPDGVSSDVLDQMNEVEDPSVAEERDVEMEDELSADIAKSDALDDYDIEVDIEGQAITEYLTLLESSSSSGKVVPSQ